MPCSATPRQRSALPLAGRRQEKRGQRRNGARTQERETGPGLITKEKRGKRGQRRNGAKEKRGQDSLRRRNGGNGARTHYGRRRNGARTHGMRRALPRRNGASEEKRGQDSLRTACAEHYRHRLVDRFWCHGPRPAAGAGHLCAGFPGSSGSLRGRARALAPACRPR
jgi:hypothetical protein